MNFSTVIAGTTSSSFSLSITGVLTRTTGDAEIDASNSPQVGDIRLTGDNATIIEYVINPISNLSGPGTPITISSYVTDSPIAEKDYTRIGATVTLSANQTAGTYTGSYEIQANYQTDPATIYTSAPQPVTITVRQVPTGTQAVELDFGRVLLDPAGGTITMTTAGTLQNTVGTATFLGGEQLGSFNLTGEAGATVNITFSASNPLTGPGTNIILNNLVATPSAVVLSGGGTGTTSVSGAITYSAGQAAGFYSGSYTMNIDY